MKVKNAIAIVSLMFGMFMFQSCTDDCKDVTCLNGGVCEEGVCECATGYEGEDCSILMNAKFVGTYTVEDQCSKNKYSIAITAETEPNKITFSNLGNFVTPAVVKAIVEQKEIKITDFEDVAGNRKFNGSGLIDSDGVITLTYTVTYLEDNTFDTCSTTMKK